jgi:hypothetical protein
VDESATEGEKPDDGQKDGESSNNLRIDETTFGPVVIALVVDAMKIIAGETSNDGCKSELYGCQHLWKRKLVGWRRHTSPIRSMKLNRSSRRCILSVSEVAYGL